MHGTNNTKRTDSNPSLSSSVNSSSSPAREPSRVRNVYVSSLPLGYLDHQLHELMSPFGAVASCRMFNDNKGTATTGHSYGFVLFERSCDAEAACASLDGFTLAGRKLRVQIARNGLVKKSVIRPPPEKAPARNASSSTPPTAPLTASDRTDTPPTPPVVEMVSQTSLPSMRSIHSTSPPPPSTLADSQGSITTYVQMPPTPTNAAMFVPANQPFPPPPVFVSVPWPPTSEWHPVPFISPSLVSSSSSSHTASALPPPHHPSHPSSSATSVNPWTATPHAATSVRLPAPPAPASWFSLEHQQQQRHHPHPHHANTTGPSFVASTSQFDPMTSTTYVQQYSTYHQAAGQHQQPSTASHQQQQLQLQHHQLQYHHHHHQHAFVQVGQEAPQGVQPVMFPWGFTTAPWLPATTPQNASPAQQQPPQ